MNAHGFIWRAWCWVLDICTLCEQTYPYHAAKCERRAKWQKTQREVTSSFHDEDMKIC